MRGRFPRDLLVVGFGPVFVVLIAVSLGSIIFRAQQFAASPVGYFVLLAAIVVLLALLLFRIRRRP